MTDSSDLLWKGMRHSGVMVRSQIVTMLSAINYPAGKSQISNTCNCFKSLNQLVSWLSGRTLVFDRRTFAVLRSTYS